MTNVIQPTLELVRQKLNENLIDADPLNQYPVVLSNIMDHEGNPFEGARDKIVMFLANIQRESTVRNLPAKLVDADSAAPSLFINLFVVFLANYQDANYPAGLGMISRTIGFFQQNPLFTQGNLPGLDPAIDQLIFEMENLELAELSYLMNMIGATYLPSVYYKVRMIPFGSDSDNVGGAAED